MDQITHIYTDMNWPHWWIICQTVSPAAAPGEGVPAGAHLSSDMFARLLWLSLRDGVPIP
jgi:hypothetical protein